MGEPIQLTRSNTREANRGDIEDIHALDERCFEYSWAKQDYAEALKSRSAMVVIVVELAGKLAAAMTYVRSARSRTANIMRLCVLPAYRRCGIGRQLVDWLRRELDATTRMVAYVQDTDLVGQQFFRACGCQCVGTHANYYRFGDDTSADAYEFVWSRAPIALKGGTRGLLTVDLKNRCKDHFRGSAD